VKRLPPALMFPIAGVIVLSLARLAAADPVAPVFLELPDGLPPLQVMRTATVRVRIVNQTENTFPACTAADYDRGRRCLFLGAWFAVDAPAVLSTFQHTLRLERPVPAGGALVAAIEVKPEKSGAQHIGIGLYRGSRDNRKSGPVGHVAAARVEVAGGSWFDEHRRLVLRALVFGHLAGIVGAAALLLTSRAG
jgi:hypothetical protein